MNDIVKENDTMNTKIDADILGNIKKYSSLRIDEINNKIKNLDKEWDAERVLETNAASLSIVGLGLAFFVSKKWFALSAVAASFLLQQGIQGWCPPLPLFRKLGIRTKKEIDKEKYALKFLKGDFDLENFEDEPSLVYRIV
ncbi:MAG TPA: hypothetical protein VFF33_10560 [Ignavibacteriaceae bacterium]|nr:hypothetical protein [Ignavibacteriaceae bacterium]